ncbi:hypothetical protein HANVADRAFT_20949 [Hanseniaspora valbyensis NRRL Y-1626]|uniref:glucan endo-1,3-beta-D-glucosidase n=1 Tax=Hanseniaspora valbyensis NRRL Y-1626 TaxID=766949 RepID=A0A1B7TJ15_9ASCO|nr:hypothetical protein HANVADRAFT_20949 [Hanseniaspora valbyensis NRRL Y-1626]
MLSNIALPLYLLLTSFIAKTTATEVDQIWFANVGFNGYYDIVEHVAGNSKCECYIMEDDHSYFEGSNAPLNEPLSVHFRGPLILHKFAYYTSDAFYADESSSSSSDWTRGAFYNDSDTSSASNVTFMTHEGDSSDCLGKAICYADDTGIGAADNATILTEDTLIKSDDEFIIFSNISCPDSSVYDTCGVYREGIPAYEGFYGDVKMFLFEFEAPTETQTNSSSFSAYDMPAIWLLNSKIPRQSQYPTNSNCSCWASGCGEFDIFEVLNGSTTGKFVSTFHTFQGVSNIETGLTQDAYIARETNSTMVGGVVFDTNGNTITFMTDSLTFDDSISASDILDIIKDNDDDESVKTLSSVSVTYTATSITGTTTSYKNEVANMYNSRLASIASFLLVLFNIL